MRLSDIFSIAPDPRSYCNSKNLPNRLVGVEIELERASDVQLSGGFWDIKEDGSLRNRGREFVLSQPLLGDDLLSAFDELRDSSIRSCSTSHRCSTHVHVDVRDLTLEQLASVVMCYAACESAIYSHAGKDRYDNIYCQGLSSAYSQVKQIARILKETRDEYFKFNIHEYSKYSSLNLRAIATFGSLEFRMFSGCTDPDKIQDWAIMCASFVSKAAELTPEQIIKELDNYESFVEAMVPITSEVRINLQRYKQHNILNCLDLYYSGYMLRNRASGPTPAYSATNEPVVDLHNPFVDRNYTLQSDRAATYHTDAAQRHIQLLNNVLPHEIGTSAHSIAAREDYPEENDYETEDYDPYDEEDI